MTERADILKNLSVVLVEPRGSGNVGSVARAMQNTGIDDLVLVNPCEYTNNEAYSMACKAHEVLHRARVYPALEEALSAFEVSVGTTRRTGKLRHPVLLLDEATPRVLSFAASNRVALVFGREDKGLKNTELSLCDILLEIPTSEAYGSVNLSHAVFLVCHHLFASTLEVEPSMKAAPREEVHRMFTHLERTLRALGYGADGNEYLVESILRTTRRLFGRTTLTAREVNMLRGILTQIDQRMGEE